MLTDIKEIIVDFIKFIPFLIVVTVLFSLMSLIVTLVYLNFGYLVLFEVIFLLILFYLLFIYLKTKSIHVVKYKVILIGAFIAVSIIISVLANVNDIMKLFAKYQIREFNVNKIEKQHKKAIFKTQEDKDNYINGNIETKIKILKELGFAKEEVFNKLENNMDFKELTKSGNNNFDDIYYRDFNSN